MDHIQQELKIQAGDIQALTNELAELQGAVTCIEEDLAVIKAKLREASEKPQEVARGGKASLA